MRLLESGALEGSGEFFGTSSFKLYEACDPGQERGDSLLVVWLHGADMGEISPAELRPFHRRFRLRTFFFVPLNPKQAPDGQKFNWGVGYHKAQNKRGFGFIYGQPHIPFLDAITKHIASTREKCGAARTYIMGYSMGGFGAYQLAAHKPALFDAAVSIAGYGQGTLDPQSAAPQPEASNIFRSWCDRFCPKLALLRKLIVIHARRDCESSFSDAEAVAQRVTKEGGFVCFSEVNDQDAESDPKSKKSKPTHHRYFNFALVSESSLHVLYSHLDTGMSSSPTPARGKAPPPLRVSTATRAPTPAPPTPNDGRLSPPQRSPASSAPHRAGALDDSPEAHGLHSKSSSARRFDEALRPAWAERPADGQPPPKDRLLALQEAALKYRRGGDQVFEVF